MYNYSYNFHYSGKKIDFEQSLVIGLCLVLVQLFLCNNSTSFISKTADIFNKEDYYKSRLKTNERLLTQHNRPPKAKVIC